MGKNCGRSPRAVILHTVVFDYDPLPLDSGSNENSGGMLQLKDKVVIQLQNSNERTWTVTDLLGHYDPLPHEPLAIRNEAIRHLLPTALECYDELSEAALLHYDFWKNLLPQRIEACQFNYQTQVSHICPWELTINENGLIYRDKGRVQDYSPHGQAVYHQLFSDFWFYGPLMPIPELSLRKKLVAIIRNAFLQAGSKASYAHFALFEYPVFPVSPPLWENEDGFVILRNYGIEYGRTNIRDGLLFIDFLSYEQFLSRPETSPASLTPDIRQEIHHYLSQNISPPERQRAIPPDKLVSKRLFMENGGNIGYIHRDGFGDVYRPGPGDEVAWREELIEKYKTRLPQEDHESVLMELVESLQYNGVEDVEALLEAAAASTDSLVQRQSIAMVLARKFSQDKSVAVLLTLLEGEDSYWRDYVFKSFFRMRSNRVVQEWIVQCLQGDNEVYFKNARDVLQMWGYFGEPALQNNAHLRALSWEARVAAPADFQSDLQALIKIIYGE